MNFDKTKVYTALDADQVKTYSKGYFADNLMDLKNLVLNGEKPRVLSWVSDETHTYRFTDGTTDKAYFLFYLVEEPKTARPYKSSAEMLQDFKKRYSFDEKHISIPVIWIKSLDNNSCSAIIHFSENGVFCCSGADITGISFGYLLENCTYLDGSPCGIIEEN